MSGAWESMTPRAWVLCEDERLHRFFEIELAHLGLSVESPATSERPPALVVADTDTHPVEALLTAVVPADRPLLGFGYRSADIPEGRGLFLRRPFPLRTLEATLRQLAATAATSASPLAHTEKAPPAADTTLHMDAEHMTVKVGGLSVELTPTEWDMLLCLYEHRGAAVSRDELSLLIGGGGNSVEVYICHLRRKLEKPLGRRMITTVRSKGYCFQGE